MDTELGVKSTNVLQHGSMNIVRDNLSYIQKNWDTKAKVFKLRKVIRTWKSLYLYLMLHIMHMY